MVTPNEPPPPIVKPEVALLEDLFGEITAGKLRIPRFQRPFVWRPEDMLAVFDSIRRGYPIGNLLLWDTTEAVQSLDRFGPLDLRRPETSPVTYVLDGQQRLSTLFGALRLPLDFPRDAQLHNWRWWIFYDLRTHEFVHVPNKEPAAHLFPLRAMLRTMDFLQVSRAVVEKLPQEADALVAEAEGIAQKIKSYKLAVTRIQGGTLEQAVDIFSRLNTKGQSMTPDQMLAALTYREGESAFNLADRIDRVQEQLAGYRFEGLARSAIFRAIVAAASVDVHSTDWAHLAKTLHQALPATVDAAEAGLLRAARFLLEEVGVPGDKLLPYANQIVLLGEFFHLKAEPDAGEKALLRRWFWATSFSGWFAGANTTQINDALDGMRQLARGEIATLPADWFSGPTRPYPLRFDLRSARVRTLLLTTLFCRLSPLDTTGAPLDVRRLLWEQEKSYLAFRHVFPAGSGALASNPANRVLLPIVPGKAARTQLLAIPDEVRERVLASHGIPLEAFEALKRNDRSGFIEARAAHLAQIERAFLTELDLPLPAQDAGEAEVDTDGD
ncbi:GmrSD restriction endonuclease domain-containing protein [Sorangium sp. So ce124]|uniref:GmrSD restriction endonuclease domain-containing protein n=1 Tax=Sorangium sp. So ce124 TaxID=3133280 RepID=UPI003F5EA906